MKGIIQEKLNEWLSKPNQTISNGGYNTEDFRTLHNVMNGTLEDFIIFYNAGGKRFEIWFNKEGFEYTYRDGAKRLHPPLLIKELIHAKRLSGTIFAYQIEEVQTWKNDIP